MKNNECINTFPCFYSKIETKPENGEFSNAATKEACHSPCRKLNKQENKTSKLNKSIFKELQLVGDINKTKLSLKKEYLP